MGAKGHIHLGGFGLPRCLGAAFANFRVFPPPWATSKGTNGASVRSIMRGFVSGSPPVTNRDVAG